MRRLRVAVVAPALEAAGGQAVQARALVDGLRGDGHDVMFVPITVPLPRALGAVRRVRFLRTVVNEAFYAAGLGRLRHADVVHVFAAAYWSFLLAAAPAIAAARALRRPVVLNYHSGEAGDHLQRWGRLVHPWVRAADALAVPSRFLADVFARHGYEAHVVPNVVDTSRFRYRERAAIAPRLLSVRNFEPHYRIDVTLDAFALVRERFPAATLTVAGSGSEEHRLRRRAAALAGVHVVGRVAPAAMPALYDAADVFVSSAVIDNQPVSILEAFAAGLAVVTTAPGDVASLVRGGDTALVVPPDDPAATAKEITRLIEHPERAAAMAARARRTLDVHTWEHAGARWLALYGALAAGHRATPGRRAGGHS